MAINTSIDYLQELIKKEYNDQSKPEFKLTDHDTITVCSLIDVEKSNQYCNKINYPLSKFHLSTKFMDKWNPLCTNKRGLALCHGHNHYVKELAQVTSVKYWYMVDRNKYSNPDYIADASNDNDMVYLPSEYFDVVFIVFCPLAQKDRTEQYQIYNILKNCHRIIKPNGKLIINNLPSLFYNFLNDNQFSEICKRIDDYFVDNPELDDPIFKRNYKDINIKYRRIMQLIIKSKNRFPMTNALKIYIYNYAINIIKELLVKYNYEYVEINKHMLIAKPIN